MDKLYSKYVLFKRFKKCNINQLTKTNKYGILIKLLYKRGLIIHFNKFLIQLLENYSKYTFKNIVVKNCDYKFTKKILTIFLIIKFPNIVFTNNTEYNDILKEHSKEIYKLLNKINNDSDTILYYIQLIDKIHIFIKVYNLWSMLDKRINTYVFLKMYYKNTVRKLEVPSNSKLHDILVESINKDQNEIEKSIKFMNDSNEENFFNYHKDNLKFSESIDENLYFIDIKYNLCKDSPNKHVFVELVEKTKELFKQCVPNRKDHHSLLDESLDTELMTIYLNNNILDHNYFYNIIHIIIDKVKEYQALEEDDKLEEFRVKCNNKLNNNEFYKVFIPMFFSEIFKRLKQIIHGRNEFIKFIINN